MEQDEKLTLPFMFVDALRHANKRFRKHPHWKRLEGTPWENDAAVIGADLMSDVARTYEARITELESLLAEAREVEKASDRFVDFVLRHTWPDRAKEYTYEELHALFVYHPTAIDRASALHEKLKAEAHE